MKALQSIGCWIVAVSLAAMGAPQARAQGGDPTKITEQDKKVFLDLVNDRKVKARLALAINHLRQIGLMMFEFENEYGEFPSATTAKAVKEATETAAEMKAETANDCFFQLVASNMTQRPDLFTLEESADAKPGIKLDACAFAYVSGMNSAGNPGRPLVVAPLVNGRTIFDPKLLGGKAVILRVDNSVTTLPIEADGRVLIDGKDIFDSAQPFWNGKVPPIKWPQK